MLRSLLIFLLGALVGANVTYFAMTRDTAPARSGPERGVGAGSVSATRPARPTAIDAGAPTAALPPPAVSARGTPDLTANPPTTRAMPGALLLPVQGVATAQLQDTFTDARGAGRIHDAIDIMAPAGTPVLAVADGRVEKLFNSKLGGLTLYQFSQDGMRAYYYAHLQRYADGIVEQQAITRGQVIGYVGSTGNASPDGPHLHFAIFVLGPEKLWWKGEAINPYPLLAADR